jgi:DNA-directed RNA polymerase subunit RPC12/RpoP
MTELPAAPRPSHLVSAPTHVFRSRAICCKRCGFRRDLELPPEWDRRSFVEIVCPKCSQRSLLPTGRLILLRVLGSLAFVASVAFVIYTIMHQPG